jgi:hypothetical protein
MEQYMAFRNFELDGESLIEAMAKEAPYRCARLVTALEDFIERGAEFGTLVAGKGELAVYLTPPRAVLRGVPDAAALVLVDHQTRFLEIIEVVEEYGGADGRMWDDLVSRAEQCLS